MRGHTVRRTVLSIASLALFAISSIAQPSLSYGEDTGILAMESRVDFLRNNIENLLQEIKSDIDDSQKIDCLEAEITGLVELSSEKAIVDYNKEAAVARAKRKSFDLNAEYAACQNLSDNALIEALHKLTDNHVALDYRGARFEMFAHVDNYDGYVECVYTGRKIKTDKIPNGTNMNCEHTWPQSQGAVGVAKTDIHHLFPADSKANSVRGHLAFGPVSDPDWSQGGSCRGDELFEVRKENRGNTARAKFYFSVRYGKRIGAEEEATLKQWHTEDPVDEAELARNSSVEEIQKNRNPFVDHPEFVHQISDF